MAGFKRKKEVKQKEVPKGKIIAQGGDPERYYSENPAWTKDLERDISSR